MKTWKNCWYLNYSLHWGHVDITNGRRSKVQTKGNGRSNQNLWKSVDDFEAMGAEVESTDVKILLAFFVRCERGWEEEGENRVCHVVSTGK